MVDLSIIIVNFNSKKLLEECLYSIYAATHRLTFEIIVVNNNSADGSAQVVKTAFPQVRLIENKENLGFTKANNQGLKISQGRYVLLLNNDTIVKDHACDRMVEFMDKTFKAGACGPKLLNLDGTIQRQGGLLGGQFWLAKKPKEVKFVIGAALLVRREAIDQVGLMDENLFFYNDDLDWCLSMRKAGWKVYYLPQAEVVHYGGYSSKRKFNRRLFVEGFRGGLYFVRKHHGEAAYHTYRFLLGGILTPALSFQLFNPEKFRAYLEIVALAWGGRVPDPARRLPAE